MNSEGIVRVGQWSFQWQPILKIANKQGPLDLNLPPNMERGCKAQE